MKRSRCTPLCALVFALASLASLSACGGARDGAEKELEALRTEITKLRTETAMLADRVGALERPSMKKSSSQAAAAAATGPQEASSDRPPLEVVRLEPGSPRSSATSSMGGQEADELALLGDAALGEEEDDAPRPVLRSVPGGAVLEEKPSKGSPPVASKVSRAVGPGRSVKAGAPR
jgi:hypothetical protein